MTITKDIIALAKKIDSAQEWDMDDCKALCEALDMGDEWEAADGETFEAVVEKAVDVALKADEKKEITVDDVMTALRENASAESEGADIVYYLHITEDGEIVGSCQDADETFTVAVDQRDYFGAHDAEYPDDWGACCAATEDDPDSDFRSICEDLAAQANAWLEEVAAIDVVEEMQAPIMRTT